MGRRSLTTGELGVTVLLEDDTDAERGVLGGEELDALMAACYDYREATRQFLLQAFWHPWQNRLRTPIRVRALREQVAVLHERQEAATALLVRPELTDVLSQNPGSAPPPRAG